MRSTVVVIGGGQAGLSAAYHLQRRGFASALSHPDAERTFVVLDAEPAPGGAWRHRWRSLRMATVNGIFDLPGYAKPSIDPDEPSRTAVPGYFADFERHTDLPILRPVTVNAVRRADTNPEGDLVVESSHGTWRARAIVNATGTWTNPVRPRYPGQDTFAGLQLHTHDYVSAEQFAGLRVAVVGGGISALQQLEEISRVATTFWYTRREPIFRDGGFNPEVEGREIIAKVTADVEAGRPTGSVVSYTDLAWTPYALAAKDRGALERRPMFTAIEPDGVREADGTLTPVDAILWATGFKAALAHLDPLGLRNDRGGIRLVGTEVAGEPRVHLIGFGPSQSTVGANRAGRAAVASLVRYLNEHGRTSIMDGNNAGHTPYSRDTFIDIFRTAKTIAVVGASDDPAKPANAIPAYLQDQGYDILPVNPRGGQILGQPVHASLDTIGAPIDVVDVFRPPAQAEAIARAAIAAGAKVLWFQPGTHTEEAVRLATDAGLTVVAGHCMGLTHAKLGLGPGPSAAPA